MKPVKIMFLCTGNSCRSQMAEGWGKKLFPEEVAAIYSAGVEAHGMNPRAVETMKEAGIDISNQKSEILNPAFLKEMDYIITLCGDAEERCPVPPPNVLKMHWPFPDPAKATGTEDEVKKAFREVRDDIAQKIKELKEQLEGQE